MTGDDEAHLVRRAIRELKTPHANGEGVRLGELRDLVRRAVSSEDRGPLGDEALATELKTALVGAIEENPWSKRGREALWLLSTFMDPTYLDMFVALGQRAVQEGRPDELTAVVFALTNVTDLPHLETNVWRLSIDEPEQARRLFDGYLHFHNLPPDADILALIARLANDDEAALAELDELLARAKRDPDAPGPLGREPHRNAAYFAIRAAIARNPERPFAKACRNVYEKYWTRRAKKLDR